ncbi:hypothetical protein GQ43DRAFT_437951 [Delitschia confertaspora ATCC 74209]|uniref:Uncharacterized protein n=1 Tax=Delitschia confertaspora ATCC 74209 TaxID=1513339 RepID=A0A9P4MYP1_9PLEO|nr:hypothetical protein GQ43DRAFT_437951 [Delitschia confertaspora ATCC 74209]
MDWRLTVGYEVMHVRLWHMEWCTGGIVVYLSAFNFFSSLSIVKVGMAKCQKVT